MTLDRFNPSQEGISASQTPTFTKASPMSNVERRSSKFSNNEPQSYFLNSKNFHCLVSLCLVCMISIAEASKAEPILCSRKKTFNLH